MQWLFDHEGRPVSFKNYRNKDSANILRCTYRTEKSEKNPEGPCPGLVAVKGGKWVPKDPKKPQANKECVDATDCTYTVNTGHICTPPEHAMIKQQCYREVNTAMSKPENFVKPPQLVCVPIMKKHFNASGKKFLVR